MTIGIKYASGGDRFGLGRDLLFRLRLGGDRLTVRSGGICRLVTCLTVRGFVGASPVFTSGAALVTIPTLALLTLLALLILLALLALAALSFGFVIGVNDTIVMIGVLEVVFRSHPISGRISVAAQSQILVKELLSRAAYLVVGACAFKALVLGRGVPLAVTARAAPIGIGIVFHGACVVCLHNFLIYAHTKPQPQSVRTILIALRDNCFRGKGRTTAPLGACPHSLIRPPSR